MEWETRRRSLIVASLVTLIRAHIAGTMDIGAKGARQLLNVALETISLISEDQFRSRLAGLGNDWIVVGNACD